MLTPAQIIYTILLAENAVTEFNSNQPWCCYVSSMPDAGQDNCICVYDTTAMRNGRLMTGTVIEHPGIMVQVRALAYDEGFARANLIAEKLDAVLRRSVVDGASTHTIHSVKRLPVMPLGAEQGTKRREIFSINATVTINTKQNTP